ncbi:hypothetical protein MNEG_0661 [Monoraphidium neglectum]|uniref:DNA (cytosine-5-)-methyltransferase n=1 Tax=Monoraphidium neglectum TaxID=145388 RepID=A0A0D2MXT1_9CHLO|nr:hypothetical protein MNEG_0661 [Monoraphidium neglectum]KIZ07285.1 hypothetical protein MNEG_0661 [Monoraphidium neglectum]|eukprot:XP_013906304.1 hypothetical protein MNEG_0661 [Monoraphidium neglectum]
MEDALDEIELYNEDTLTLPARNSEQQQPASGTRARGSNFFYRYELDSACLTFTAAGQDGGSCKRVEKDSLTMGDLYAGMGTMSLAARHCGFSVLFGVEDDAAARTSYHLNTSPASFNPLPAAAGGEPVVCKTYPTTVEGFNQLLGEGHAQLQGHLGGCVTVLHATPPSLKLSSAGTRARGIRQGFGATMETIKLIKPPFVTVEEVPEFYSATGGKGADVAGEHACLHMFAQLLDAGYQLRPTLLNTLYYGLPQSRWCAMLFAARDGFELPAAPKPRYRTPEAVPMKSLKPGRLRVPGGWAHALLPSKHSPGGVSAYATWLASPTRYPGQRAVEAFPLERHIMAPDNDVIEDTSNSVLPDGYYPALIEASHTGRAGKGACLNPFEPRVTTLEERCRLQGIPTDM